MLRRRPKEAEPAESARPFTYIQRGTEIVGDLIASGRVRVHGVIRGNVRVDGPLEVAENGILESDTVEAHEVKVLGRVTVRKLTATKKVEIWKGGELVGDVNSPALDIEEGAHFTGRSEMPGAEGVKPEATPAPEASEVPSLSTEPPAPTEQSAADAPNKRPWEA